jgi:septal ring factor EnvC (AmiA/AmiB activator)
MPEESGDQEQTKPWDAIIIDDTMTENERVEALHRQAELLEDEIRRVRSATKTRLHLAEEAERARQKMDEDIYREEEAARSNPFKKRKKVMGSTSKSTDGSPTGASDAGKDDNEEMKEAEVKHGTIELGASHVSETPPR